MTKRPTKEERVERARRRLAIDELELAVRRIKHSIDEEPIAIQAALANADVKLGNLWEIVGREPLRPQDGRDISGTEEVPTSSPAEVPGREPDSDVKESYGGPF